MTNVISPEAPLNDIRDILGERTRLQATLELAVFSQFFLLHLKREPFSQVLFVIKMDDMKYCQYFNCFSNSHSFRHAFRLLVI